LAASRSVFIGSLQRPARRPLRGNPGRRRAAALHIRRVGSHQAVGARLGRSLALPASAALSLAGRQGLRVDYRARLEDRGKALPAIAVSQPKSL